MLAGPLAERLQSEISHLQQLHRGVHFEPHVTLLADIKSTEHNILETSARLAASVKVGA